MKLKKFTKINLLMLLKDFLILMTKKAAEEAISFLKKNYTLDILDNYFVFNKKNDVLQYVDIWIDEIEIVKEADIA